MTRYKKKMLILAMALIVVALAVVLLVERLVGFQRALAKE